MTFPRGISLLVANATPKHSYIGKTSWIGNTVAMSKSVVDGVVVPS